MSTSESTFESTSRVHGRLKADPFHQGVCDATGGLGMQDTTDPRYVSGYESALIKETINKRKLAPVSLL